MISRRSLNLGMIEKVALQLKQWNEIVVYLGGAVTALYLTDPAAPDVRPTEDVDFIILVHNLKEYYQFEQVLTSVGFTKDIAEDAPICRWRTGTVLVDAMPTAESILGFSNRWYEDAYDSAVEYSISEIISIKIPTTPYFLATKIEAFLDRGNGDYRASKDIEDIVTILDGRDELVAEVQNEKEDLQAYLADNFMQFLSVRNFDEYVAAHLYPDEASQSRLPIVIDRFKILAKIK